MQPQPWLNFGLQLGADGETVTMPEAFFRSLTPDFWARFEDFSGSHSNPLTKQEQERAWKMLGRYGNVPEITIAVSFEALKEAAERVRREADQEEEEKKPLVIRVQSRLDSYKNNKERLKRIKALELLTRDNDGYSEIGWAVELWALKLRLQLKRIVTAKEVQDFIYAGAAGGTLPMHVNIEGSHVKIPQEVIDRNPPPKR